MDFWDLTRLLFRRWWVALPLLVLTGALTLATFATVTPNYTATAYVQLVPPAVTTTKPDQPSPDQRNPWLRLGLEAIGNAATVSVLDQSVIDELARQGYSDSYTVEMNSGSPLITFEVVGDSQAQARDTANNLVKRFTDSVGALQVAYGVREVDEITARRLDVGNSVKESDSNVKRALIAVAAAGLLLTAGVTVGVDAWLRRRSRRANDEAFVPTKPAYSGPPPDRQAAPSATRAHPKPANADVTETIVTPASRSAMNVPVYSVHRDGGRPAGRGEPVAVDGPAPAAGVQPGHKVPGGLADHQGEVDATIVLPLDLRSSRGPGRRQP